MSDLLAFTQLLATLNARDWDLHVERAGARAGRAAAGERHEPLWVATAGRGEVALEAQARTPEAAVEKLWVEVTAYSYRAATRGVTR